MMLPSHLQSQSSKQSHQSELLPSPSRAASLPLGLTGVLCDTRTLVVPHGTLQYTVFRPRHLQNRPPLICVAGGPLLPCAYLSPLAHLVTDRSIVIYDAIGCGQSPSTSRLSRTTPHTMNTQQFVAEMVLELIELVKAIQCDEYYLYGHSFGGVLVYEYLKQVAVADAPTTTQYQKTCRGAILSSVPWSISDCQAHCQVLLDSIRQELGTDADEDDVSRAFSDRHECRTQPLPLPLQQAFQLAGFTASNSAAGLKAVNDYSVELLDDDSLRNKLPPALILRGEYDFITLQTCNDWAGGFGTSQCMTLAGCSHYGMVEHESIYGSVMAMFLQQHDPPLKPLFPTTEASMRAR